MFDRSVIDDFRQHALQTWPEECCGLVAMFETGCKYVPCQNIAQDRTRHFVLDPHALVAVKEDGGEVLAVLHSHVHTEERPALNWPSEADLRGQVISDLPWGIAIASKDSCTDPFYFGDQIPIAPLIGREFRYGVYDCFTLVRDYFRLEKGITIPPYASEYEWWLRGENHYLDMFPKVGFVEIDKEEIREGDCFLMRLSPSTVPQHAGIYLGDGTILHHLESRLSRREGAHGWRSKYTHWLRYQGDHNA